MRLLDTHSPDDVTADMLLAESGISRGSLYHHFRDFKDVIEHAQVERFSRHVDESIATFTLMITRSTSREEFLAGLNSMTDYTQGADRATNRADRVWLLGQATIRPTFREILGAEQQRLTTALTDLIRDAQHKGWVRSDIDTGALAVFIQAYTLGAVINDITESPIDPAGWTHLIKVISVILCEPTLVAPR